MIPASVLARELKNRTLADRMPVGCRVRAIIPMASLKPGETAEVIEVTAAGELRLRTAANYTPIVNPAHLELVPNDIDDDPL